MVEIVEEKKDPWGDYQPPDLAKFVGEAPLYTKHTLRLTPFSRGLDAPENLPKNMPALGALIFGDFAVDAYCPACGEKSIFRRRTRGPYEAGVHEAARCRE